MEIIPILSTIVLVATVSTFLLAIGAYILFKIRERKGTHVFPKQPAHLEAELITPIETKEEIKPVKSEFESKEPCETSPDNQFIKEKEKQNEGRFQEFKKEGTEKKDESAKDMKKEPAEEKKAEDSKFLKYTSEGYIPPKEDKNSGAIRWR